MKYSTRLSDAVHLLLFIYLNPKSNLSSMAIAESVKTHPSYVRQIMSDLKKAGLLNANRGQAKPSIPEALTDITLLDIYHAVEGDKPLLHQDTHTNPECGVGINIQLALRDCYNDIQKSVENKMRTITLQHILDLYYEKLNFNPLN